MREKLIELLTEYYGVDPAYYGIEAQHLADHLIANGVTIPVRCKDCNWYTERENVSYKGHFCVRMTEFVHPDDFCSYGERRTDGN